MKQTFIEIILYVAFAMPNGDVHEFEPTSWIVDKDKSHEVRQTFDDCAEAERFYMTLPGYRESDCYSKPIED